MKTLKYLGVATLLATGLVAAPHAAVAADVVTFAAAGSSAQFGTFTTAFLAQGYSSHYTLGSSSSFQVVDPNAPNESAQVAVYWKGSAGNYQIAVFYQVDSTVGVRAFFNNDTLFATATPPAPANPSLGAPFTNSDVIPPAEVLATVNGTAVNVGATDITPEDARVATERSINLGYNNTNPIKSAVATTVATPVRFSLTAKPFTLTPLGAVPIVVFINNGPTFASATGSNLNIDSFTLAGFLSGQFNRTSDFLLANGAAANPVHTYVREPLSGTYNTMEYTNPESLAKIPFTSGRLSGNISASGGQELNVSATANNPLNETTSGAPNGVAGAGRLRAIGTGQLVKAVNADATDALGYSFYSVGNFTINNSAGANIDTLRYVTVDGADPIQDNYTGGLLVGASVSFRNIINGGYPLWSILRVVTQRNPAQAISDIITSAQGANQGTDFVKFNALRVFRSYHQTPFTVGTVSNGNNVSNGGSVANGGDVGGAVLTINNDQNAFNDTGNDLTNVRQ